MRIHTISFFVLKLKAQIYRDITKFKRKNGLMHIRFRYHKFWKTFHRLSSPIIKSFNAIKSTLPNFRTFHFPPRNHFSIPYLSVMAPIREPERLVNRLYRILLYTIPKSGSQSLNKSYNISYIQKNSISNKDKIGRKKFQRLHVFGLLPQKLYERHNHRHLQI